MSEHRSGLAASTEDSASSRREARRPSRLPLSRSQRGIAPLVLAIIVVVVAIVVIVGGLFAAGVIKVGGGGSSGPPATHYTV